MNELAKKGLIGPQLIWLILTGIVLLLDQGTKYIADEHLSYGSAVTILPVFDLTLLYNTGAAFSFLADAGGWQRWVLSVLSIVISIVLVVWLNRLKAKETWLAIALALILGGAIGNLYDRVTLGYVIDFISMHYQNHFFPAFNVADSAITAGAAILLLDVLFNFAEGQSDESD